MNHNNYPYLLNNKGVTAMHRKFPKLSPEFEAHHMENQETLKNTVAKRQAEEKKKHDAGMLRINKAQAKVNR